jgi:hypothetical protein
MTRTTFCKTIFDRTERILDASVFVPHVLARYASIEADYGNLTVGDWTRLQEVVVDLYMNVLRYAMEVQAAHSPKGVS